MTVLMRYTRWCVLCLLFIHSSLLSAQNSLEGSLNGVLSDVVLSKAYVGVSIRNVKTNKVIFEKNANRSFTPASNLKLTTTAAALDILGPEYRFVTKVLYSDSINSTGFKGVLLIQGSGDPTFGSTKMPEQISYQSIIEKIIRELKLKGLKSFDGVISIDPTHFEYNAVPMDYTWGDIGNYYGAGSFGFNMNDNQSVIVFKPSIKIGGITSVQSITPWDSSYTFINHVATGSAHSGDESVIYSSPYNTSYFAEGSIPAGSPFAVKASISNPAGLFATLLVEELKQQQIAFNGKIEIIEQNQKKTSASTYRLLYEFKSPTLKEIATYTNLISNNLYAECLLKEIAYKKGGIGSTSVGVSILKKYLSEKGIDTLGLVLRDGSGMSPFNSISPNQFTQLLTLNYSNNQFVSTIPIAGKQGTVSHICKESANTIRVKSGTMNGTTCYSGYVQADSGEVYAVSLLVNKHEVKNRTIQFVLSKVLMEVKQKG